MSRTTPSSSKVADRSVDSTRGTTPRGGVRANVMRSKSAGSVTRVAFGRAETRANRWEAGGAVVEHPHRNPCTVHIDELGAIDCVVFGGTTGSVRLEQYIPAHSQAGSRFIPGYSLREPVIVKLEHGVFSVAKPHRGADTVLAPDQLIASAMTDDLTKIDLTSTGVKVSGRFGFEVTLTIHSQPKQSALYKLLLSRIKRILPSSNTSSPSTDASAKPQTDATEQQTPPRSAGPATQGAPTPVPHPLLSKEKSPPSGRTAPSDREQRRSVLYAQLRSLKR